jgi:hypothetical protein
MAEETAPGTTRRQRLRERRQIRAENSRNRQAATWKSRFDAAQTPLDLLGLSYSLLRSRLVQWEQLAAAALDRARTDEARAAATERLEAARADVQRLCDEVVRVLAETADQLDTSRK